MTLTIDVKSMLTFVIGAVFVAVGVAIIALIIRSISHFIAARKFEAFDREAMRSRWREIEALVEQHGEVSRKLAIMEADKLLDHALKTLALPGTTLGERLKFATYKYPKLNDVWWAHKVRNQLAHEATYHLDAGLARKALKAFKHALETLGAI